jgi:hypothetical protein
MLRLAWYILSLFYATLAFSQGFSCGCEQLVNENYGKAKKSFDFQTHNRFLKQVGLASYFFKRGSYDLAYDAASLAQETWSNQSTRIRRKSARCQIDSLRILEWKNLSVNYSFEKLQKFPTIEGLAKFVSKYTDFNNLASAVNLRDSLLLFSAVESKKSSALRKFLNEYPQSYYQQRAKEFLCELEYWEEVKKEDLESLEAFVKRFPQNCKMDQVHFAIYSLYVEKNDLSVLEKYISTYADQPWVSQAWRILYELYVGEWNAEKIGSFKIDYPNYPFIDELTRDLELLNEELYPFVKDDFYGFMNSKGKIIISPSYEEAGFFKNGLAIVQKNNVYGAINKRNHPVIPFSYETLYDFNQDVAIAGDSIRYGLINRTGDQVIPIKYSDIKQLNPVVYLILDSNGYKLTNKLGVLLKDAVFEEVTELASGNFSCVKNQLTGVLDHKLNEIVPFQFEEILPVNDTLFVCKLSGKYGLYGVKSRIITPPIYERLKVVDQSKNLMLVKKGKEMLLLKFNGTKHLNNTFEYSSKTFDLFQFYQNNTVFCQKGKYGLMDVNGKIILKPVYEDMGNVGALTPFKSKGMWGFLEQNNVKLAPVNDEIFVVNDEFYLLEKSGKQGIINKIGKEILPSKYSSIKWMNYGFFILEINGNLGVAANDGTIIVPCEYKNVKVIEKDLLLLQNLNEMRYFIPSKALWINAKYE